MEFADIGLRSSARPIVHMLCMVMGVCLVLRAGRHDTLLTFKRSKLGSQSTYGAENRAPGILTS